PRPPPDRDLVARPRECTMAQLGHRPSPSSPGPARCLREAAPPGPPDPGGEGHAGVARAASEGLATAPSAEAAPRPSPPGSGGPGGAAAPNRPHVEIARPPSAARNAVVWKAASGPPAPSGNAALP